MARTDSEEGLCPRCGGRGWLVESDGAAGRARRCDCRRERVVPRLLEAAGVPPRYSGCTLSNFHVSGATASSHDQLVAARAACVTYLDEFVQPDGRFAERGLLFVGPPGVGKTHLAAAVLRELIDRYRVRGLFVDFTALIHEIQATFDPQSFSSKDRVLEPVMRAEVLVLDDLGAQKRSDWVNETLYLILNTRYTRRLTTLFTTNYRLDPIAGEPVVRREQDKNFERQMSADARSGSRSRSEHPELLEHRISPSLLSRLYEMARIVRIEAGDFRREVVHAAHVH